MSISRRSWLATLGAAALVCVGAGKKHKGKTVVKELWLAQDGSIRDGKEHKYGSLVLMGEDIKHCAEHLLPIAIHETSVGSIWGNHFQEFADMHVGESVKVRLTIEVLG